MMDVQVQLGDNQKALSIPSIYLNSSSDCEDGICLHTPQDGDKFVHFDVDDQTISNDCYGRRASQRSWCSEPYGQERTEAFNWLDTFDPSRFVKRKLQKRHSSSSSSGYTQSASHISTCGSNSHLDACDRYSLPGVCSETDLRLLGQNLSKSLSSKRQVKSCSNLAVHKGDNKCGFDDKSESGTGSTGKKSFEDLLDKVYNCVPQTMESQTQKEERIQRWLKNLRLPSEPSEDLS